MKTIKEQTKKVNKRIKKKENKRYKEKSKSHFLENYEKNFAICAWCMICEKKTHLINEEKQLPQLKVLVCERCLRLNYYLYKVRI